jgi:hypothetical protein
VSVATLTLATAVRLATRRSARTGRTDNNVAAAHRFRHECLRPAENDILEGLMDDLSLPAAILRA